uniref:Uncharacterized protein n=1 Tax=Brassica oleracea TaxID=3712 RepID=A0A3P6G3D8_BRAOL|nr:unnamed protein product [Brassica oleracea]
MTVKTVAPRREKWLRTPGQRLCIKTTWSAHPHQKTE